MKLEISPWLLQVIDKALQGLPYREAAPAIEELNEQIKIQRDAEETTS